MILLTELFSLHSAFPADESFLQAEVMAAEPALQPGPRATQQTRRRQRRQQTAGRRSTLYCWREELHVQVKEKKVEKYMDPSILL